MREAVRLVVCRCSKGAWSQRGVLAAAQCWYGLGTAGLQRHCATGSFIAGAWWPQRQPAVPRPKLVRLTADAQLYAETDVAAEPLAELSQGELVEAIGDIDEGAHREWLLVRFPLEDQVESMSDKPLAYQNGWLFRASLQRAEHQLGDKVAALVDVSSTHPVLGLLRKFPWWKHSGPPTWMASWVSELYTGKVEGVIQQERFLVQRPAGAMPERIATKTDLLVTPKARARQTATAGLVGLALSTIVGLGAHARAWLRGERPDTGRSAWPQLVGWASICAVLLTPAVALPCYGFANSQASTMCVVAGINLLLYRDLFGE